MMNYRKVFFYAGWGLLALAFAAGAAEAAVRAEPGANMVFISARQLWYSLAPADFVIAQIHVERLSPVLWDPVALSLLAFPAWALLGLPGAALTWSLRPRRELSDEERADLEDREATLFLYDELARDAHDQGYRDGDDMAPSHEQYNPLEADGLKYPDTYLGTDYPPDTAGAGALETGANSLPPAERG